MRLVGCVMIFVAFLNFVAADDSTDKVREGMRLYSAEQFEEASKSFAAATESLEKAKSDKAAIAAFDEACALHRKGDLELARERYLKAGLSHDKTIATNAHFNIGVITSEQARKLAGETPETVPADKRKEILAELRRSIDSYRHCLELQPQYAPARRNLELLRQWIKYHTDRWREADLQKRRDETNLIQFLEYLVETELSLKKMAEGFRSNTSPNAFAELKRVQDELREEIPYLKEKIDSELRPKENDPNSTASNANSAEDQKDLERGIELLKGWADKAGDKMAAAGRELMKREAAAAADNQKRAADQLDQIWDAVVPFYPLLAKELAEQSQIAKKLTPPETQDGKNDKHASAEKPTDASAEKPAELNEPEDIPQKLEVNDKEWSELKEQQERTLRKTRLLGRKAESEMAQVEKLPKADEIANDPVPDGSDNPSAAGQKIDPEAIKAGYQKAMELAPKAVEEMESAVKQLDKRDREQAAMHAEEARRILKEIQDAQPKNPDQDKNQQQDNQENKDKDQEQNKKEDENKDSMDEQRNPNDKKPDKQEEEKKKSDEDKKDKDKKKQAEQQQEPKVSKDRIEEALRRVREREQEKRERDRELKARVLGRVPVDKDW